MGINKFTQHLLILSEDDAVRQVVLGFLLDDRVAIRRVQSLPVSGGCTKVRDAFLNDYAASMLDFPLRHILLVFDCDGDVDRIPQLQQQIPADIRDRVFLLGSLHDPEALSRACGKKKEAIGKHLATECAEGSDALWSHEYLAHNQTEAARLSDIVVPFMFK
ncbi:MAG: hypothetical protein M5R41_18720 [Bacteroidia bacterium]|nr:hypothetical protein [Bacteroidia bacterium]